LGRNQDAKPVAQERKKMAALIGLAGVRKQPALFEIGRSILSEVSPQQ